MKALHNITYGLFVLTAKTDRMNGCIINTLMQVTANPAQISVTINKDNLTTKMIKQTGEFNVSILDMSVKFDLIKRFGFSSGKEVDKFVGFKNYELASNGIPFITEGVNSYISAKVVNSVDLGSHITFIAEITNDVTLNESEPVTYAYYLSHIKPKVNVQKKGVFVCRICGYVYEGEQLPDDFICPICKHGAKDFEYKPVQTEQIVSLKKYYCPVCDRIESSSTPVEKCSICGGDVIEIEE